MSKIACRSRNFTCLAVGKCEKGREIAISALTPDKITHRRVCIRVCYTNKTYVSWFDNSRCIRFRDSWLVRVVLRNAYCSNFFKMEQIFLQISTFLDICKIKIYIQSYCHFKESKNLCISKITKIVRAVRKSWKYAESVLASCEMYQMLKTGEVKLFAYVARWQASSPAILKSAKLVSALESESARVGEADGRRGAKTARVYYNPLSLSGRSLCARQMVPAGWRIKAENLPRVRSAVPPTESRGKHVRLRRRRRVTLRIQSCNARIW